MLFGLWYCYKRGREERIKAEGSESQEILVEGAKPQSGDVVDHGDGVGVREDGRQSTSVVPGAVPVEDNTPLQVESEPIPASAKKSRKSWFKSS